MRSGRSRVERDRARQSLSSPLRYNETMDESTGHEELEHTADWALRVWAPDLPGLFAEAARGMYHLMGVAAGAQAFEPRTIEAAGMDAETLLVDFLTELLLLGEEEGLMVEMEGVEIEGFRLNLEAWPHHIRSQQKEIKAVTFHNLEVRRAAGGFETTIVFDV